MLSAFQTPVTSSPTLDFTEELVTNAQSANYDLVLPGRGPKWFVRAFAIVSVQNLAFELALYSKAANGTGVFATEHFLANWQFGAWTVGPPASPGYPSGADGLYKAYIDGNLIPYEDLDQTDRGFATGGQLDGYTPTNASLHVRLINRSSTTKEADEAGAVQVTFYVAQPGIQA